MGVEPIRAAVAPHAFPRPLLPLLLVLLLAVVAMVAACRKASAPLPAAGVRLDQTSVSGLSSGAYMAGQFQLAHADIVIGAGIVPGGMEMMDRPAIHAVEEFVQTRVVARHRYSFRSSLRRLRANLISESGVVWVFL